MPFVYFEGRQTEAFRQLFEEFLAPVRVSEKQVLQLSHLRLGHQLHLALERFASHLIQELAFTEILELLLDIILFNYIIVLLLQKVIDILVNVGLKARYFWVRRVAGCDRLSE